jgi:tRNA (cmo5U34)-methyltransferase
MNWSKPMLADGKHFPSDPTKFVFDAEVTAVFDSMAVRSIPCYREVWGMVSRVLADTKLPPGSQVWDIGCSTGTGLMAAMTALDDPLLEYYGIDISQDMVAHAAKDLPMADIFAHDLKGGLPGGVEHGNVGLILCNWTLQFLDSRQLRRALIRDMYQALAPGGYMIICEKFRLPDPKMELAAQRGYLWWRRNNGYSVEEIVAKTIALSNSMWPWSPEDLADAIPTDTWEWMYRLYNFGGVIVRKHPEHV